jgi:hypothetical protein
MNTTYPEDHPLHNRTDKWIAAEAKRAAEVYLKDPMPYSGPNALAHEHKRLEAEAEKLRARNVEAVDTMERWLTRAIELSGAPEGSDWAGLLEHIDGIYKRHRAALSLAHVERTRADSAEAQRKEMRQLVHDIGLEVVGPTGTYRDEKHLVPLTRKLRERCEAAESGLAGLHAVCEEYNERVNKYRNRYEVAEARIKALEDEAGALLQKKLDSDLVKWQVWVDGGGVPMADTPTQPPLERIAAALEALTNA